MYVHVDDYVNAFCSCKLARLKSSSVTAQLSAKMAFYTLNTTTRLPVSSAKSRHARVHRALLDWVLRKAQSQCKLGCEQSNEMVGGVAQGTQKGSVSCRLGHRRRRKALWLDQLRPYQLLAERTSPLGRRELSAAWTRPIFLRHALHGVGQAFQVPAEVARPARGVDGVAEQHLRLVLAVAANLAHGGGDHIVRERLASSDGFDARTRLRWTILPPVSRELLLTQRTILS
eukprot:6194389-Pleurochrysis_carterae.AAC.2